MKTAFTLLKRTFQEFSADNCSQMAAAISYYVIFSIVPLTVFLLSVFGLVVQSEDLRENISNEIVDFAGVEHGDRIVVPDEKALANRFEPDEVERIVVAVDALSPAEQEQLAVRLEDEGQRVTIAGETLGADELSVRSDNVVIDTLRGVSNVSAPLGILGLVGMAWSASAMFGAMRKSINIAWGLEQHRPVVQQKLVDLGMVAGLGLVLIASVSATGALRTLRELGDDGLGPISNGTSVFWAIVPFVLPAVLTFGLFALVYRFVPATRVRLGDVWPGALLATVLFEAMKNAFALYLANFSNYDLAYGALGGILIFLLWTYLTANILLLGAEMASLHAGLRRGESLETGPPRTFGEQVRRALRGLVFRHPPDEEPPRAEAHRPPPAPPAPPPPSAPHRPPPRRAPKTESH